MLQMLSGRRHRVLTAIALGNSQTGAIHTRVEKTDIRFASLTATQIAAYVASGQPMDKAGSYGIQELPAEWIVQVRGCYQNVVGLPVCRLLQLLKRYGPKDLSLR